jgi:hypothetical protein
MATSLAEAMQDRAEFFHGHEVAFGCTDCPRRWYVHLADGARPSADDYRCPMRGCDGYGELV